MDPQTRYKEKSVIIHRDENGFGLRVGGQNPVFVDCVHENGAAWKAGVRKDDRIIKVNGTLVRSYDHQKVVQMIQNCSPFVNLTLHSPDFAPVIPIISQTNNNTRDNPYYYYKTAQVKQQDKLDADSTNCGISSTNTSNITSGTTTSSSTTLMNTSDLSNTMLNNNNNQNNSNNKPTRLTTRRLEIIRELVDTEKTHIDKLKQLNDVLYNPMKADNMIPPEQLKMVFSCHRTLFKIHRQIYRKLVAAQVNYSEQPQNQHQILQEALVGKALVEIFEGELGKQLEKAASIFCACQSTNTELLNRITRKDTKTGEFLAQAASQQMLGRLGIKDLLASCFQRLTKYPLLLENLLKATPNLAASSAAVATGAQIDAGMIHSKSLSEGCIPMAPQSSQDGDADPCRLPSSPEEYAYERCCIGRALKSSREILIHVNEAVNRAVAQSKLKDIWKKTDKHPSLPVIDIDEQQLLHEGSLTLRLHKRQFEVYVLLLTHYLIILTREGADKYKLKYFTSDAKPVTQLSPVFKIDEHLVTRDSATDLNGFYLLCKRKDDERIYEFASQSPLERTKWKEKIHTAQFYNFSAVPDDDNLLTRYTELISLTTDNSTTETNNIEHSPTGSLANSSSSTIGPIIVTTTPSETSLLDTSLKEIIASPNKIPSLANDPNNQDDQNNHDNMDNKDNTNNNNSRTSQDE